MQFLFYAEAILAMVAGASCASEHSTGKICTTYNIPVTTTSVNWIWGPPQFKNNYDAIDFISNFQARVQPSDFHVVTGREEQTASYSIGATFCTPKYQVQRSKTVLIATHGLDFDREYWDLQIPGESGYSFVDYALTKGYSVFYYDRLGTSKSSLVSGYINQVVIQIEILNSLATFLKEGRYTGTIGKPSKLILVGHSIGSGISAGVLAKDPNVAEGLILTSFNFNSTVGNGDGFIGNIGFRIVSEVSSSWKSLDTGYLTPVDTFSNVNVFLKAPDFTISVADYAFAHRSPIGILEPISLLLPNLTLSPTSFTGPALLLTDQHDFIFCTGNCDEDVLSIPAQEIFSKAKAFKAVSYPGSGHGLNLAKNVIGAYEIIFDFLASNGL